MDNIIMNIFLDDIDNAIFEGNVAAVGGVIAPLQDPPMNAYIVDLIREVIANAVDDEEDFGLRINPRNNFVILDPYWYDHVLPRFNDNQFHAHFRMFRSVYQELENIVAPYAEVDEVVPLKKKLLMTIWLLATPETFRSVADRFGLHQCKAHQYFKQILVILRRLMPLYITWPHATSYDAISDTFWQRSGGFPGVIGAIDGTHIEMKQPPGNSHDYYNRKGTHSVILQGVCDHTMKFIDVFIGRPGRLHDITVFRSSPIYQRIMNHNNPVLPIDKHILGDAAYMVHLNVMTPFRDDGHLDEKQIQYNIKHASLRSIIERTFGMLKGKWRRLFYLDVKSVRMANFIIAASCVLHNFTLLHNDENNSSYMYDRDDEEIEIEDEDDEFSDDEEDVMGIVKRNIIKDFL